MMLESNVNSRSGNTWFQYNNCTVEYGCSMRCLRCQGVTGQDSHMCPDCIVLLHESLSAESIRCGICRRVFKPKDVIEPYTDDTICYSCCINYL